MRRGFFRAQRVAPLDRLEPLAHVRLVVRVRHEHGRLSRPTLWLARRAGHIESVRAGRPDVQVSSSPP
jgi:hypothetical protein